MPKVSIIVPVYNVERYLDQCVQSLINQTYQDIEIILVDDGSTDKCPAMCDEYEKRDKRIKVIHKENEGLSSARNTGIESATGEYLFFVDSDDFISTDCIEALYEDINNSESDCSITAPLFVYKNGKTRKRYNKKNKSNVLTNYEAVNAAFYGDEFNLSACGKLFKKELLENIRFPHGKMHEDAAITYKLLLNCNKVSYISDAKYFYLKRNEDNITAGMGYNKILDIIEISEETVFYISTNAVECYKSAVHYLVTHQLVALLKMSVSTQGLKDCFHHIKQNIKKYRLIVIKDKRADSNIRLCCVCTLFGLRLTRVIWKIYNLFS